MIAIRGKIWDSVQEEAETLTLTQVPLWFSVQTLSLPPAQGQQRHPLRGAPGVSRPPQSQKSSFAYPSRSQTCLSIVSGHWVGQGVGESLRKERKMSLCWCREVRTCDYNQHLEEPLGRHLHPEKVIQCQGCRSGG